MPITRIPPQDSVQVIFSPRKDLKALKWYASRMDKAHNTTFLTEPLELSIFRKCIFKKEKSSTVFNAGN